MKKLFLLATLFMATISASAQFYVGGEVGFSRNVTENKTDLTIAPEVGYVFNDKWSFAGVIDYSYHFSNPGHSGGYDKSQLNIFEISPYARYTYASVASDRLKFFVDCGVGFGLQHKKGGDTGFVYHLGFKPGVAYALNDHYSLVAHLGQLGWEGATDKVIDAGGMARVNKFTWNIFDWNAVSFGFYYSF